MTRNERLIGLFDTFDRCAEAYCERSSALFCEILPVYKGAPQAENLKYRCAFIYYHSFVVEFKYTSHSTMNIANSILECLVYLGKNQDSIAVPLPLLLGYLGINEMTPLCLPSILQNSDMRAAFDCIGNIVLKFLPQISEKLGTNEGLQDILTSFIKEMAFILDISLSEENFAFYANENLYAFLTLRLTSAPFINYIKEDHKTAIKQLRKAKKKMAYEESLLHYLEADEAASVPAPENIKTTLSSYAKNGLPNTASGKDFCALFFSWLVLCIGFTVIYGGLYLLLICIESRSSVYLMGPMRSLPCAILSAFITAIAASYFTRFRFYKLFFPKDFERFSAMDHIHNGKGSDKLMRGFLIILVVASIAFAVLFTKWNINFLADGFVDNSKFLSVSGEHYDYTEIDHVYYKPDRINDFGDTLDFPSYVIVLKDGKEIDLYEFDEIESYEQTLLPFLRENGVKILSAKVN